MYTWREGWLHQPERSRQGTTLCARLLVPLLPLCDTTVAVTNLLSPEVAPSGCEFDPRGLKMVPSGCDCWQPEELEAALANVHVPNHILRVLAQIVQQAGLPAIQQTQMDENI
eukprot:9150531-Pyramimonas_sp.AAC.1